MGKYNVDLMLAVREQITSHPETHHQGDWARRTECGTTLCIAGWACQLSGESIEWHEDEDALGRPVTRSGELASGEAIWDRAQRLLGLPIGEAGNLFHTMSNERALHKLDELIEKGKNQS